MTSGLLCGDPAAVLGARDLCPQLGLVLRAPDLELRPVGQTDAVRLANSVAAVGIHDPDHSPFATPWTDGDPVTVARSVFANLMAAMRLRAEPDGPWAFKFVLFDRIGGPVGVMDLRQRAEARDEVVTGSWLLRSHHGQGLGTQARAAVLKLAFEALGVREARTAAYAYNAASLGVTRKLGYTQVGVEPRTVRGLPAESLAFAVDRPRWAASPAATALNPHISWTGLDAVADLLGTGVRAAWHRQADHPSDRSKTGGNH